MKTLRGVAVLGVLAAAAGGVLAWFAAVTEDAVRENRSAAESRVLRDLAGVDVATPGQGDVLFCKPGLVVLRGVGRGYGGEVQVAVAADRDGEIKGVRVLAHSETPGFSDILAAGGGCCGGGGRDGCCGGGGRDGCCGGGGRDGCCGGGEWEGKARSWLQSFGEANPHAVTGATVTSSAVIAAVQGAAARAQEEKCLR